MSSPDDLVCANCGSAGCPCSGRSVRRAEYVAPKPDAERLATARAQLEELEKRLREARVADRLSLAEQWNISLPLMELKKTLSNTNTPAVVAGGRFKKEE